MASKEILFNIAVNFNHSEIDEGIVYRYGKCYYIEYNRTGRIAKVSKEAVDVLSTSLLRI